MLEQWVAHQLDELAGVEPGALMDARYARFRRLGAFDEVGEDPTPTLAQPQAAM
jgi:hypothetical protein